MTLNHKVHSLSLIAVIAVALAANASRVGALKPQASSSGAAAAERFAGTWHWMFHGKSFSTMVLVRNESGYTGTVTPSRISLDDDGGLSRADPSEDGAQAPIVQATLQGSALLVTVKDGFAFTVSLKDDTHAEIRPVGAPPNMKAIPAEKAQ